MLIVYNGPKLMGFFSFPKAHSPNDDGGKSHNNRCKNRRHNKVHLRPPEKIRRQTEHLRRKIQRNQNGCVGTAPPREPHQRRRRRREYRRHEGEFRCERDDRHRDRQKQRPRSAVDEKWNPPSESVSQR